MENRVRKTVFLKNCRSLDTVESNFTHCLLMQRWFWMQFYLWKYFLFVNNKLSGYHRLPRDSCRNYHYSWKGWWELSYIIDRMLNIILLSVFSLFSALVRVSYFVCLVLVWWSISKSTYFWILLAGEIDFQHHVCSIIFRGLLSVNWKIGSTLML